MQRHTGIVIIAAAAVLAAAVANANVSIETVPVGNPGNAGELSGQGAGGQGENRICGAVDYTYNIGKYEVTVGQYTAFLNSVGGVDTYGLFNTSMQFSNKSCGIRRSGGGTVDNPYTYTVASGYANRPVVFVSWGDAARFANWAHNGQPTGPQGLSTTEDGSYFLDGATTSAALVAVTRKADATWVIPSEDEWYKAAYYNPATSTYYNYPTSSDNLPGRDMTEVTRPGNNANCYATSPYPIQQPYYTTAGGEFELSDSPYGTFDQAGNAVEWTEAVRNTTRGIRGSAYEQGADLTRAAQRDFLAPYIELPSSGFRVVLVPEPGTIAMSALAGLAMMSSRKR
jgi:formylglycine-generating enzyme